MPSETTSVRACEPSDEAELTALYEHLSTKSVYQRFFGLSRAAMMVDIERLTRADIDRHVALVAIEDGLIVGVASLEPLGDGRSSEISLVVTDAHQRAGIGGALLQRLEDAASSDDVGVLVADTLCSNVGMLRLLEHAGFSLGRSPVCGVVHATLDVTRQKLA